MNLYRIHDGESTDVIANSEKEAITIVAEQQYGTSYKEYMDENEVICELIPPNELVEIYEYDYESSEKITMTAKEWVLSYEKPGILASTLS